VPRFTMLQPHSLLWHYLWVAPNILLLVLGFWAWKRGLAKQIPAFLAFAILTGVTELCVYAADVLPWINAWTFWRVDWANLLVEGVLKFVLIGEIFEHVFGAYASVAKLGKFLIRAVGVVLVLTATLAAAYAPQDGLGIISGAHLLEQTIFIIESGLIFFLVLFAAYFRLAWDRSSFGILLGLGISACVHLGTWAVMANAGPSTHARTLLDFLNMATYHFSVLIWSYYLLVPQKVATKSAVAVPQHNLELWNREVERFLHP
jgi:hypothetical protein